MKSYLPHVSLPERIGSGKSARYQYVFGTVLTSYAGDKTDNSGRDRSAASRRRLFERLRHGPQLLEPVGLVRDYQAPEIDYLAGESDRPLAAARNSAAHLSITYVARAQR